MRWIERAERVSRGSARPIGGVLCCLAIFGGAGCSGGSATPTAEVEGEVRVAGELAEGVEVHFVHPLHKGFARTDAYGRFRLQGGAAIGENRVYFSKIEGAHPDPASGLDSTQLALAAAVPGSATRAVQLIPAKYSRYETTDQRVVVPESGATEVKFDLKP